MERLNAEELHRVVQSALTEDVGSGDVTTLATVPAESRSQASMVAREPLVVGGMEWVQWVYGQLSAEVELDFAAHDRQRLQKGETLLRLNGPTRALLTGERVALNFVQRLSGIATLTAHYVDAVAGTGARIVDTRKTTPGWRQLEKYAVRCGGGENHRMGLYDQVLIKDNHLAALRDGKPNPIAAAVERARMSYPRLKVEVETDSLEQVEQAVTAGADIILLDNMELETLRKAVATIAGRARTEASGGVNLNTVRAIAETGVDTISVGALTHGARSVDIALDFSDH